MKKFILMLLVIVNCAKAQDTIRFRSGDVLAVKVNEVGLTEINYNRFDNLQGPKYVVEKNDVSFIKYSGGHVDSFQVVVSEKKIIKPSSQPIVQSGEQKIIIRGNKLLYNNRGLGESRLGLLVKTHPDNAKRNAMMKPLTEMKRHRTKQYVFGFVGLGVGLISPYIGFVAAILSNDLAPLAVGAGVGAAVGITGAVVSTIQKNKRKQKKMEVVSIYNN
jgi:hypothetical protein